MRQAWNVIEGQLNGVPVVIFDSVIGERGGHPCTFVACHTEENPFGTVKLADRVIQSHGWTVLHGVWFLWFSWVMRIQHLEQYVEQLRVGRVSQSN
jgi:hypothetical protein